MYRKAMEKLIERQKKIYRLKVLVEKHKTKYSVRTSMTDYRRDEWIINIPLYFISNIEKMGYWNKKCL